jgi:hypothetical protein
VSAMSEMSKAIRTQIEWNSTDGKLSGLHHDVVAAYVQIVGAFYADLQAELERREKAETQP